MRQLQVLVKPVSGLCNLQCNYCFYVDEMKNRQVPCYGRMDEDTLEMMVEKVLEGGWDDCTFAFQGGEPLLAGMEFYENMAAFVKKWKKARTRVHYAIQTNGTLIDDDWISFFKREGFLVGVSLDGTQELHDRNRADGSGNGSYRKAFLAAHRLQNTGVPLNILCVLTRQTARKIMSVYEGFVKNGFLYQQYLPCLDELEAGGEKKPWSLSASGYADAVKTLFDLWFQDYMRGRYVHIREFDNWIAMLRGFPPEACAQMGRCGIQYVIEASGDVFPCDFYVLDRYRIANLRDRDFHFGKGALGETVFLGEGRERGRKCLKCRWYPLCRGGCRRDYVPDKQGGMENRYCSAYQEIFAYCIKRLKWLASVG